MEKDFGYRKIQITGRGSYIISLPKAWISGTKLTKGNQVAFRELQDSSLLLTPRTIMEKEEHAKSSLKTFTVNIDPGDDPQSIHRRIVSLYTVSADTIHIRFNQEITAKQKTAIKHVVRMLLGSELIAESSNTIDIRVFVSHPEFHIETAIRRMLAIAQSMDKNTVLALTNFDETLLRDVIDSDDDLDRLCLYVVRQLKFGVEHGQLKEMGLQSMKEFLGYRIVAKNLENIGDNAESTALNMLDLKRFITSQRSTRNPLIDAEAVTCIRCFNSFASHLLETAMKALFKRDYHLADTTISQFTSAGLPLEKNTINQILNMKMEPNVTAILRLIIDNSKKIMDYSRDVAEIALNRTVEEISTPTITG
ncbi:MAG: phosphate uptake regulator PhoU [Candidatus Bathyarchaeota archaeon]|nr:MAG: phosphate uptake regulator PhoU [Candidatus Bathyarchaeota archaeon]